MLLSLLLDNPTTGKKFSVNFQSQNKEQKIQNNVEFQTVCQETNENAHSPSVQALLIPLTIMTPMDNLHPLFLQDHFMVL